MADNRRAGERTIFRGDVEGNDTLAEISKALETERRTPIAVGAGFMPPAGGQVSNIPAMADLEDELLREFALYENPAEQAAREPARKIEPSFEPAPASVAPPRAAAIPAVSLDDEDDTMPPMDADTFRAARPLPIVRTPSLSQSASERARIEPEAPAAVFSAEDEAEADARSARESVDAVEGVIDETVQFSGPVSDLAGWDPAFEDEADEQGADLSVDEAGTLDIAADDFAVDDVEPVFAGPVPDLELDDEPAFAGPVPEIAFDRSIELDAEPAFDGPVPDLDFSSLESEFSHEQNEAAGNETPVAVEQPLGALDLMPAASVEPASPFAAWKNDRLAAVETAAPSWLSAPTLAPKALPPMEAVAEIAGVESEAEAVHERAEPVTPLFAVTATQDLDAVADVTPELDPLSNFEFDFEVDDLVAPDVDAEQPTVSVHAHEPAAQASIEELGPAHAPAEAAPYVSVEPDLPSFAAKTAAVAAIAAPAVEAAVKDHVLGFPDWLQSGRKVEEPAVSRPEKDADFDFKEFEFDFDEDAIEAEVSRAVMSELQTSAPAPVSAESPFDPSAITEIEDRMPASFGSVDVPQVLEQDGEALPKPVSDFDYDIEAEMAELFAMGGKSRGAATGSAAATAENASPADDGDGLDNGLANELIRSIHETPAIPAGRAFDISQVNAASTSFVSRYARVAAAAAIIAFAGLGAVMLWRAGDVPGVTKDGTPRVIMADKSPIKEVPDQPGGKQVPNQDKAVYDRVAGNAPEVVKQGSLIANSEEPVNVAAKTLGDDSSMPQAPGVTDGAPVNDADARLPATPSQPGTEDSKANESVSPRKVKTMIVLPNGTLVARETTAPAQATPQQKPTGADAAMTAPASTEKAEAAQPGATIAPANGAPVPTGIQQAAADKAPQPKPVAAPIPTARPADQPVNVVGTVTQRGNVVGQPAAAAGKPASAPAQVAATKPSAPVASGASNGAYVIQIASLPSEAEAQKSYANLSSKFSSVIGGKSPDIKPAEIPGKGTYYRLRIVAGSKDEAIALCTRYKAAGGSCLVSR